LVAIGSGVKVGEAVVQDPPKTIRDGLKVQ